MLSLNDEQGVEHGHPAVQLERKQLFRVRVGARELDPIGGHILAAYSKSRHFSTRFPSRAAFRMRPNLNPTLIANLSRHVDCLAGLIGPRHLGKPAAFTAAAA